MMNLLNIINDIANSNFAFTVLIVILVVVGVAMIYLIYSQQKEIKMENERRKLEIAKTKKSIRGREEAFEELKEEPKEEIKEAETDLEELRKEDTIEESLEEFKEIQEEVRDVNFDGVPYNKVIPEYDNVEEEKAEEIKEEYTGDIEDLQSITKELEILPKEKTIELTPYEEEQESKAIISYEELINNTHNDEINYSNTQSDENVEIKQVDLEKTGNIEIVKVEEPKNTKSSYSHEEEFLDDLKSLQHELLN